MVFGRVGPVLAALVAVAAAQQEECFSTGDIVGAVIGTIVILALLVAACYGFWKYYWIRRQDGEPFATNEPTLDSNFLAL
jgi:hypothetical protein